MIELDKVYNEDCIKGMERIPDSFVDCVLTDIPYGECSGRTSGIREINKGKADSVNFDMDKLINHLLRVCKGSFYVFCGIKQISNVTNLLQMGGVRTRLCIWEKTNPSPLAGKFLWLSSIEACVFGRKRKSVFNEFCKSSVWREKSGESKIHPTQKPINLFKRLILASSRPEDLILDPFMGSGTTAIACIKEHRHFIGFEKDKEYYEKSLKRISESTKQQELF